MTNVHREYHSCSSDELFLESLDELREVYERNSYPKRLVESKINLFSPDFKKPELVPFKHTIVLEYTSPLIDSYIRDLTEKMQKYLPSFKINIAYRSVKVKKLFGFMAKAKIEKFETSNVIYEFTCLCGNFYIGQTFRTLNIRVDEHHKHAVSNICAHKVSCDIYKNTAKKFVDENALKIRDPIVARFEFFKTKFEIIGRGYKTDYDRERTEAYFIRTKRPKINKQTDQDSFRLF